MKRLHRQLAFCGFIALAALLAAAPQVPLAATASVPPFGSQTFIKVAKRLRHSVIHIQVLPKEEGAGGLFGTFGKRLRKEKKEGAFNFFEKLENRLNLGAGLIVSHDGYILTNYHVVKDAAEINVKLADGEDFPAHLIGRDEKTDLALLKIEPTKTLVAAPLGDSDRVEVGEWVVAIGSPFGLSHSVTVGVVSGKGRVLGDGPYDDYLQSDAAVNPGNSGGPLANIKGEVIGINTAIFSQGRNPRSLGISFAIPINQAKSVLDDLRHKGFPIRGRLGATVGAIPSPEAKKLGLRRYQGARLEEVGHGGPAHNAGLRRGDIVVKFDGREIITWEMLPRLVARARPDSEVEVKFLREGDTRTVRVRMGGRTEKPTDPGTALEASLGMKVVVLTPGIARRFDLDGDGSGLVVSNIVRGGSASEGGILPGDRIIEVNHTSVRTLTEYKSALKRTRPDGLVLILVRRKGSNIFSALKY